MSFLSARFRGFVALGSILAGLPLPGALAPVQAQAPAPPGPAAVHHYKRLIFADTLKALADLKPPPGSGPIVVAGVPVLETKEFENFLLPYIGRAITTQSVNQLAKDVGDYVRKHDRIVVNVLMANQDISAGDLRLAVVIGRYSELKFKGNRWFSDRLLESKLGVKPGDEVRLSVLESALTWANANPFRHLEILINTVNKQPGIADLDVSVQEHIPVRVGFTYDDTGNDIIGNNHYTGLVQFGNLWGLDHQASLQYTTTDQLNLYQAENFDYRIPLRWHHYIVFDAAYAVIRPTFGEGAFNEVGKDIIADVHYVIPFNLGAWKFECSSGLDFKQLNNNLLYGGFQVQNSADDIFQFTENFSGARPDRHGAWAFAANVDCSPGGFNTRNTDAAFADAHFGQPGWPSRYIYSTLVGQRRFDLPQGFQSFSKAIFQVSSANLLSSEELVIGGQATVRGYNELLYSGDQGVVLSEELQGPVWQKKLPFLPKNSAPFLARPLLFLDYARVTYKHFSTVDISLPPLMSTGFGLRANLATNFSLSFDYGWQILKTDPPQPNHDRGHVKVTLAY